MATTKQLVRSALLGAFIFAGKWVLSCLPNIHPVALLLLLYTVCLGARSALAATAVYVMLEGLFYGFGDWWLAYCWAWPLWVLAVHALRKNDSALLWAVAAGFFGLLFEALFLPVYLVEFGLLGALARLVSGIPFSVAHCAGGSQGRKSQKNTPRARAAWKGGTRPFSACNSVRPPGQVLPKTAKPHVPLSKNRRPGTAPAKSGCTRRVAEKGETCRPHAFKVVLE